MHQSCSLLSQQHFLPIIAPSHSLSATSTHQSCSLPSQQHFPPIIVPSHSLSATPCYPHVHHSCSLPSQQHFLPIVTLSQPVHTSPLSLHAICVRFCTSPPVIATPQKSAPCYPLRCLCSLLSTPLYFPPVETTLACYQRSFCLPFLLLSLNLHIKYVSFIFDIF